MSEKKEETVKKKKKRWALSSYFNNTWRKMKEKHAEDVPSADYCWYMLYHNSHIASVIGLQLHVWTLCCEIWADTVQSMDRDVASVKNRL